MKKKVIKGLVCIVVLLAILSGVIYERNRPKLSNNLCGTFRAEDNMFDYFSLETREDNAEDNLFWYTAQSSGSYGEGDYIKGTVEVLDDASTCAAIKCSKLANKVIIPDQVVCCDDLSFTVDIRGETKKFVKISEVPTLFGDTYE